MSHSSTLSRTALSLSKRPPQSSALLATGRSSLIGTALASAIVATAIGSGCTGQLPNSFRFRQAEESFSAVSDQDVNTKIDLLWVIDNSASMDVSQQRLRDGFRSFAQKYMKPSWDIRVAVITTDTYLANPAFANYLNMTHETAGYKSNYLAQTASGGIPGRATPFVNPPWAPTLINTNVGANYGKFTNGAKVKENWPKYGPNWAKLLPGNHDGPMTTLCYEGNPYFFKSVANCRIRDNELGNLGMANCVNPGTGESSVSQCVNTSMNDTIHSGKSIIATMPPAGTPADQAWTDGLIRDFLVNLSTGASGSGSERGLQSVLQLLNDNEAPGSATAFFRAASLRVVVFVGDEEDQSTEIPASVPANFYPFTYYTTTCAPKTVDGYTYTISQCAQANKLIPVAGVKAKLDTFFSSLDATAENASPNPNYFVVSIVATTGQGLQQLHAERTTEELALFGMSSVSCDRADRYIELGNLVGNGSLAMDITSSDYSPLLDSIGQAIVAKKSVFELKRAPTGTEDLIFLIKHANGTATAVRPDQYVISAKTITITDYNLVLSFSATDQISISYQPKTAF